MRLSKPDQNDPTKRRHFEISIDSPFHILSCRATQANISLPAYTSPESGVNGTHLYDCGCPGAARRRNSPIVYPAITAMNAANNNAPSPQPAPLQRPSLPRPPTAHLNGAAPSGNNRQQRPMHILRAPSFQPPAFEEEAPPPALITPPPQYDSIASPTSGLADYFARLSDTYDEEEDSGDESHRGGRVNIPLTPGGRVNRSMDIGRGWMSLAQ